MNLGFTLVIDIVIVLQVSWFVLKVSERSIFNPALLWIALHIYTVTFRLGMLNAGFSTPLFVGMVTDQEIVNAVIADDLALIGVAIAVGVAAAAFTRKEKHAAARVKLDPFIGDVISAFCLTIGTAALLLFGRTSTGSAAQAVGDIGTTSYPRVIAAFAAQGAVIQCALRGFSKTRVFLLFAILGLAAVGLERAIFILPALMAILVYHSAKRRKGLNVKWIIMLIMLGVVWFGFKPVAFEIARGDGIVNALEASKEYFLESTQTGGSDTVFLDEQATFMSAADEMGKRFYGGTVLPLLYTPIPHYFWSDKPSVMQFGRDLSSPSHPIAVVGMMAMLAGESYINFGWIGCLIIPFLYMLAMLYGYYRTADDSLDSARRWLYLVLLVTMIQVFRDGLNAILLFGFMNLLALSSWPILSAFVTAIAGRSEFAHRSARGVFI